MAQQLSSQLESELSVTESEIKTCLERWAEAISTGRPELVAILYAADAVLLPTFDPAVKTTMAERHDYFIALMTRKELHCKFDETERVIQPLSADAGVVSGLYTFSHIDDSGNSAYTPARYSFTFVKNAAGSWQITEHHSSVLPTRAVSQSLAANPAPTA